MQTRSHSTTPLIPASTFVLPYQGTWPTVLDCLCDNFPNISRENWLSRFERQLVLDSQQSPIRHDLAYRAGLRIYYYREIVGEKIIPSSNSVDGFNLTTIVSLPSEIVAETITPSTFEKITEVLFSAGIATVVLTPLTVKKPPSIP